MAGNSTANTQLLIQNEIWQAELDEILFEELLQLPFYREVPFPQGNTLVMPSIGTPEVRDLPEESVIIYDALDAGQVSIQLNDPIYCANSFTQVLQEDSFLISDAIAQVPALHAQAIKERILTDLLALANYQFAGRGDRNLIGGVAHRMVAGGTNQVFRPNEFALAAYTLRMSKIPMTNLVAIVHPSVGYALETSTNLVNVSNNPKWEGIVETGIQKQMKFVKNVFGFDVYESNFLPAAASETVNAVSTNASGVANIFMSLANERLKPFVKATKAEPRMSSTIDFDADDTLKIKTRGRYGTGLLKDENLVVILSNSDQVV